MVSTPGESLSCDLWVNIAFPEGAEFSDVSLKIALAGGKIISSLPPRDSKTVRLLIKVSDVGHARQVIAEVRKVPFIEIKAVAVNP